MSLIGRFLHRDQMRDAEIFVAPQHDNAAPQQLEGNQHQPVPADAQRFAQPVAVNGVAPAPQMEQAPQQQPLNRKQQRRADRRAERQARREEKQRQRAEAQRQREAEQQRQEAERLQREREQRQREEAERAEQRRREEAKRMAETKIAVDNLVEFMKTHPIEGEPSTDYHGLRPTETFEEKGEFLERVILTHIGDKAQAETLLKEAREVTRQAAHYDKMTHDFRFRNQNVPVYIENVLKQRVSPEIERLLMKEAIAFSEANHDGKTRKLYGDFELKVFDLLNEEQKAQATSKDMIKGIHAEAYNQAIAQLMEQHQLTRDQAQTRYAEEKLREKWGN